MEYNEIMNLRKLLDEIFNKLKHKKKEENIIFLKAWNEWGEGNYLEPEIQYGLKYLEEIQNSLENITNE